MTSARDVTGEAIKKALAALGIEVVRVTFESEVDINRAGIYGAKPETITVSIKAKVKR